MLLSEPLTPVMGAPVLADIDGFEDFERVRPRIAAGIRYKGIRMAQEGLHAIRVNNPLIA